MQQEALWEVSGNYNAIYIRADGHPAVTGLIQKTPDGTEEILLTGGIPLKEKFTLKHGAYVQIDIFCYMFSDSPADLLFGALLMSQGDIASTVTMGFKKN